MIGRVAALPGGGGLRLDAERRLRALRNDAGSLERIRLVRMRRRERTGMRPARLLVGVLVALVLAGTASVALAARQVALVVGNSSYAHIGRLPNPENDARRPGRGASAGRVRGDDGARRQPGRVDRGTAGVHALERGRGRLAGLLRGPRPGDGRRQLPGTGSTRAWSATSTCATRR